MTVYLNLFACNQFPSDQENRVVFGDGTASNWVSAADTIEHVYPAPGTYTATFQARQISDHTNTASESFEVTIGDPPQATSVAVSPANPTIWTGQSVGFSAQVYDQNGNRMPDREAALVWTSGNTAVATMTDASGPYASATAVGAGTTTITAAVDGVNGSAQPTVTDPPPPSAAAAGNSFEAAMAVGQFYAVSLYMDNTGGTTWSDVAGYGLTQVSPGGGEFSPAGVAFGTGSTTPGARKTFHFNLRNDAPTWGVSYDVYYRMHRNGTPFGDSNGRRIESLDPNTCVKNCGPLAFAPELFERMYPGSAVDEQAGPAAIDTTGEIVQRLSVPNYRLYFLREGAVDVAHIRYFGALAEPWAVDVTFRLEVPPGLVVPGQARKNVLVAGYEVVVEPGGPGVTLVHLRRTDPSAALPAGELLFLDIPLNAAVGLPLLERLTLVELVASR